MRPIFCFVVHEIPKLFLTRMSKLSLGWLWRILLGNSTRHEHQIAMPDVKIAWDGQNHEHDEQHNNLKLFLAWIAITPTPLVLYIWSSTSIISTSIELCGVLIFCIFDISMYLWHLNGGSIVLCCYLPVWLLISFPYNEFCFHPPVHEFDTNISGKGSCLLNVIAILLHLSIIVLVWTMTLIGRSFLKSETHW